MWMEEQEKGKEQFEAFLERKNIDAARLLNSAPSLYEQWLNLFSQVHEESFVMQQKFRINPIRRMFPKTRYVP